MEIKVGSEWKKIDTNIFVRVLFVNDDYVATEEIIGFENPTLHFIDVFKNNYKQIKDFEWKEVFSVEFLDVEDDVMDIIELDKNFEILYNYKRFREEVDTTKLDWDNDKKLKWCIEKMDDDGWYVEGHYTLQELGALYFSNEEYAEQFLDLVKENVNE